MCSTFNLDPPNGLTQMVAIKRIPSSPDADVGRTTVRGAD